MHALVNIRWVMLFIVVGLGFAPGIAEAHINLLSPKPLMDGHAMDGSALKAPPFGAPGLDAVDASATTFQAGETIMVEVEGYIYHPGEIVVLWTRDPEGEDVMPAMEIPSPDADIPHHNLLARAPSPERRGDIWKLNVTLPNVTGEIYLVVRQVMTDKLDAMPDGSVSLARIYYHQAAKLHLQ